MRITRVNGQEHYLRLATTGLVTAKINAKIGAIAGSVVPVKGTAIGGIIGATTGLPAAFNYMAINSYMVEGGNSYLDAITRVVDYRMKMLQGKLIWWDSLRLV